MFDLRVVAKSVCSRIWFQSIRELLEFVYSCWEGIVESHKINITLKWNSIISILGIRCEKKIDNNISETDYTGSDVVTIVPGKSKEEDIQILLEEKPLKEF